MSYASDLWDGTNIVTEKARNGLKGAKGIVSFFKERSQVEEGYASALIKTSKASKCDTFFSGTVGAAVMSVRSSTERMGVKHLKFSKDISEHICIPLSALEEQLSEDRKRLANECQRLEKELQTSSSIVAKAKSRQHKLAKEAQAMYLASKGQASDSGLLGYPLQRPSASRVQQAIKEAKMADAQYFDAVKQMNHFQKKYNEQMSRTLEQYQNNDEKMLYVVKTMLLQYIEIHENTINDLIKDVAAMHHAIDAIDADLDISHFIMNYRTGKTPQTSSHYEPYSILLDDVALGQGAAQTIPDAPAASPSVSSPAVPITSPSHTPSSSKRRFGLSEFGSIDESAGAWISGFDSTQFGDMPLDETPITTAMATNVTISNDYFSSRSHVPPRATGALSPRNSDENTDAAQNDDDSLLSPNQITPLGTSPISVPPSPIFLFHSSTASTQQASTSRPTTNPPTHSPELPTSIPPASSQTTAIRPLDIPAPSLILSPVSSPMTTAPPPPPPPSSSSSPSSVAAVTLTTTGTTETIISQQPPPDPDLPDSQQMIAQFTELLNVIISGNEMSDQQIRTGYRYLESPEGRMAFALALNNQRTQKQLETHAFTALAALVRLVVDKSYFTDDVRVSRLLMNMGQTFYRKRDNTDQYLQELIKDHPIWKDPRFWEGAFFDSLAEARVQQGLWDSKWKDLPEELQAESIVREENIVFGQLGSFAFNMLNMDNDLDMARQFVRKMCMIHTVNEYYVRLLLENVERSHDELEAEKLKQDKEDWKRRQKIEWQRNRSRVQRDAKPDPMIIHSSDSQSSLNTSPTNNETRSSNVRIGRAGVFFFVLPVEE